MKHAGRRLCLLAIALGAACTPTPNILPTNDLNRPTDIAFMCLGTTAAAPSVVTGKPMSFCHPPAINDAKQVQPAPSIQNRTFAFVPNSASGDLSIIDADSWKLLDLNKSTAGFGRVPLGTLPEQISTTSDGCRLISTNRGSCDLSLVNPSTLLAPLFASQYGSADVTVNVPAGNGVQRIQPRSNGTLLAAAPYEAVFLPQVTSETNVCPSDIDPPTTPWRALVTFPSCNLIALMDLPTGDIVASARAKRATDSKGRETVEFEDAGTSPTCAADCGGGRMDVDGGAVPVGTADDSPRPTGIAIAPTGDRAYVSFANVSAIMSLGLSPTAVSAGPLPGIPLNDGAQGSNRIRLGVDPYNVTTTTQSLPGRFIGDRASRAYLYVIARDGSLRIIDVFSPGAEQECETNFDALNPLKQASDPAPDAGNRCIPYGSVNRRPYSTQSAGLRFPTIPIDVAAADMGRNGDQREDTVNGAYAWVLTANGTIFIVNIDPVPRTISAVVHEGQTTLFDDPTGTAPYEQNRFVSLTAPTTVGGGVSEPTPFPNRPRDRSVMSYSSALDPSVGPVRVDVPPLTLVTSPYVEPIYTQGTEDNAIAVDTLPRQTYVFFPDREGAVAQGWDITWQGTIISPRYSGVLRGDVLTDGGGGFCQSGVQVGDIVTLNGCAADTQCPLGMVCRHDTTVDQVPGGFTVTGICVSANLQGATDGRCNPYVSSLRRYDVVYNDSDIETSPTSSQLKLKPHIDEVVRSSLSPCRMKGDATGGTTGGAGTSGGAGAGGGGAGTGGGAGVGGGSAGTGGTGGSGGAAGGGGTAGSPMVDLDADCHDPNDGSTNTFHCVEEQGRRCLNRCTKDQDCRNGRVCLALTCNDVSECPSGTSACKNGLCFTDADCDASGACAENRTCSVFDTVKDANGNVVDTIKKCSSDRSFCADGPPLQIDQCFPQLVPYQVNANAAFMVTGAQSGSFANGIEVDSPNGHRVCGPDAGRDPRLVSRIPLRPAPGATEPIACDRPDIMKPVFPTLQTDMSMPSADGYFIDHFDPVIVPKDDNMDGKLDDVFFGMPAVAARPEAPQLVEWMKTWTRDIHAPNACLYLGGPILSDLSAHDNADPTSRPSRLQHVRARFRNTQIAFVLANIDRAPPTGSTIHFEVHGGFRPQQVTNVTTVEISAPARLLLGPIDSGPDEAATSGPAPFFFVVDQRRLGRGQGGGPTRGQIVRVDPFGLLANGYLPIYEDYGRSNGLFPIQ